MKLLKQDFQPLPLLSISAESEEHRNKLVLAAKTVTSITDNQTNLAARNAAVSIRECLKETEAERVRLNTPLLRGQRTLKAMSDEFCEPLVQELDRLERLAAAFMEDEKQRVARESAEQDSKLARLLQEQTVAAAASAQAASNITNEAELARALEIEAKARETALAVQTAVAVPLPKEERARGQSSRQVLRWECTDIVALYNARPDLVKLTPSASLIQELCVPECPVPGLKMWWENKATYSTR